jgi:hypothetical protein
MDKPIKITKIITGHKHTRYEGICGVNVTVEDIKKAIYHPRFGGRGAWVSNGKWGAVRHND